MKHLLSSKVTIEGSSKRAGQPDEPNHCLWPANALRHISLDFGSNPARTPRILTNLAFRRKTTWILTKQ